MAAISVINGNIVARQGISTLEFGGTDLGATSEKAVVVKYSPEYADRMIGQSKYAILRSFVKGKCTVDLELADVRLSNLQKAYNQASGNLSASELTINDTAGTANTLKVIGLAPNNQSRTFYFYSAMSDGEVNYNMGLNEDTVLPITFTCLYSGTALQIGYILDAA
jgi:hypothetical protein